MGNKASFAAIEKKYGEQGVEYVLAKHQQRQVYEQLSDEMERLRKHAQLQQDEDIEYIRQERRKVKQNFDEACEEAEKKKKGIIEESEAKSKQKVEAFSGYNDEIKRLEKVEEEVKEKHAKERERMEQKVREEVDQSKNSKHGDRIPEYDDHPDNYRRNIERDCVKKHGNRKASVDATEIERKIKWDNFKQNFEDILDRKGLTRETDKANKSIRNNVVPGGAPICC